MTIIFLDALVAGILTGGIYGALAVGLSLIFGVMRFLNFAHGDFIMLAMFLAFFLNSFFGISPLILVPVGIAVFFFFGFVVYKGVIRRAVGASLLSQVFLTYGLSLVIENSADLAFGSDYRIISTPFATQSVTVLNVVSMSTSYLIAFSFSIAIMVLVSIFLARTKLGVAMRAVSQDVESATLMRINVDGVRSFTFALGIALAGGAGVILTMIYYIYPYLSLTFTIDSFIIVILGGMGSVPGAAIGGLFLGVSESVSNQFLSPALQDVWAFVLFLIILRLKPSGLLGRARA